MARTAEDTGSSPPEDDYRLKDHLIDLVGRADMILDQLDRWVGHEQDSPLAKRKWNWEKCVLYVKTHDGELTMAERSLSGMLNIRKERKPPAAQIFGLIRAQVWEQDYLVRLLGNLVQGYEEYVERESRELMGETEGAISRQTWKTFWCGDEDGGRAGIIGEDLWLLAELQRKERELRKMRRDLGLAEQVSAQHRGGVARAKKLTPAERSAIASKAAKARWAKKRA